MQRQGPRNRGVCTALQSAESLRFQRTAWGNPMRRSMALALGLMFVAWGSDAAVITTFSGRDAFNAAAAPQQLIDFEQYPVGPLCALGSSTDPCVLKTQQGVDFVSTLGGSKQPPLLSIDSGLGAPLSQGLVSNAIPVATNDFYWDFSASSLGLDIVTAATFGHWYSIVLTDQFDNTYQFAVGASTGAGAFFGFLSDVPIRRMSIYDPCPGGQCFNLLIDNVAVGGPVIATPVPEPEALAMLLLGFGVVALAARRRKPI